MTFNVNRGDYVEVAIKGQVTYIRNDGTLEVDNMHCIYDLDSAAVKVVPSPLVWTNGDVVQALIKFDGIFTTWVRGDKMWESLIDGNSHCTSDDNVSGWVKSHQVVVLRQQVKP